MSVTISKNDADQFRAGFTRIVPQIKATLPRHVSFEKFERVAMMAVQREPELLKTDHRTLFLELQKCASDGLLPDGRQAVIVRRWNSKLGKEAATYQPMVAGLRQLMRNSGEVAALHAQVVYEGEPFRIILGDEERIEHERRMDCVQDDKIIGAYAVATLSDGEKVREFMTWSEIEKARNVNKYWAKGPWANWKAEMCRKTVVRRLYKSVPQSVDKEGDRLQQAIERDDEIDAPLSVEAMPTIDADPFEEASAGIAASAGHVIDEPNDLVSPMFDAVAEADTADALGSIEKNAAFKSQLAKLPPADASRVHAAIRDRYQSLGVA